MKKINKIFALLFALLMFINPIINVFAETNGNNQRQIGNTGGESVGDGVKISKTISPSELENYFDITLKVQTTEIAKEQDVDIVIVMDISRSMVENKVDNGKITRLKSAVNAAEKFIKDFANYSSSVSSSRKIGYVDFNTNAYEVFSLQNCNNQTKAEELINKMRTMTNDKVFGYMENGVPSDTKQDKYFNDENHTRFTNIEAGLQLANDMLKKSNSENKFIILLSDGFPTTYMNGNGYNGYDTYTPLASSSSEGQFYDSVIKNKYGGIGRPCSYGTDYSEIGARKAQLLATKIKNTGVKIYSVGSGIDTGTKTVDEYANYNYDHKYKNNFSTVDRIDTDYAIGHSLQDFKRWLGGTNNSQKPGIGSGYDKGYYFDTTDSASLNEAYAKIFENIKKLTEASWVAEDPMNSDTSSVRDVINFVGIYDNNKNLSDSVSQSDTSDNTASFDSTTDKINWDLKKSKYTKVVDRNTNTTYYNYELKYRIRLKTEANNFESEKIFKTNGKTTLTYIIKESGKDQKLGTLTFKVPEVKGYLGTITFDKLTNYGNRPLKGSTFEIYHSDDCPCLKERRHIDSKFKMTSVSNSNGKVIFDKIPSGHKYKIHEVSTDDYHDVKNDIYDVNVSYGETTSPLKDTKFINNYKTRNLTIIKVVEGVSTTKKFKFEIEAIYRGNNLEGTYDVVRKNGNTEATEKITFSNGKATIELKDKEQITIKDLPYGISYKIRETNNDGFIVKYQINDGTINIYNSKNIKSYTLDKDSKIKFTNISGYVLPATGSSGMLILLIIGSLLLVVPIIYISVNVLNKKLTMKH